MRSTDPVITVGSKCEQPASRNALTACSTPSTVRSALWKSTPANPLICGSNSAGPLTIVMPAGTSAARPARSDGSGSPDRASNIAAAPSLSATMGPSWYYGHNCGPNPRAAYQTEYPEHGGTT